MASKLPAQITKGKDAQGQFWQLRMSFGPRGNRQQINRKYRSEGEATRVHTELSGQKANGIIAAVSKLTVEQACADFLGGKRGRSSSESPRFYSLQPLRERHGAEPLTDLTKAKLDILVNDLLAGGIVTAKKRHRRPWMMSSVRRMIYHIKTMLESYMLQGLLTRNNAKLIDLPGCTARKYVTFSQVEVRELLAWSATDRREHIWHLALCGLRRGEITGMRWSDIDLVAGTLTVDEEHNRTTHIGGVSEGETKTDAARRTLPLTPALKAALRTARKRQAEEKLKAGHLYKSLDYVACTELGDPYHPNSISKAWPSVCRQAGVKRIRLHDARHTCGTLMALQNVPPIVIASWLGHTNPSFTMRTYVHPQADGLEAAHAALDAALSGALAARDVDTEKVVSDFKAAASEMFTAEVMEQVDEILNRRQGGA